MKLLITLTATACTLFMAYTALQHEQRAFELQRAYDSAMEHIEALNRTHGVVDSAYICRIKTSHLSLTPSSQSR
jgi:hypothetical protein